MIGPVDDYRSIYVAKCGRDFPNRQQGIEHERECPACQGDTEIIATCEACGGKILEGDTYGKTADDCYLHTGCAEGDDDGPPQDSCIECEAEAVGYSEGVPYCAAHYRSRPQ